MISQTYLTAQGVVGHDEKNYLAAGVASHSKSLFAGMVP